MAYQQEFSAVSNIISDTEGRTDLTPQEKQKALQQVLQQHPGQASQLIPAIAMLQKSIQPQTQAMAGGGIVAFKQGGKIQGYARGSQVEWKLPDQMQSGYDARQAAKAAAWAKENRNPRTNRPTGTNPYVPVERNTPTAVTTSPPVTTPGAAAAAAAAAPDVPPKVELDPHYFDGMSGAGISSLSGRGSGSLSMPKLDIEDPDVHDRKYYMDQQQDFMGNNDDLTASRAQQAKIEAGHDQEAADNGYKSLAYLGLYTAASQRSDFLGAAAEGGIKGLDQYSAGRQQAAKARSEDLARRLQIGSIERQERAGMYHQGAADERADKHAKTEVDIARLHNDAANARAKMSVDAMNKPAAIQDARAQYFAHEAYKDDIKNGIPPQGAGAYYQIGQYQANPGSYAADARSDTARLNKQMDVLKAELKAAEGNPIAIAIVNQKITDLNSGYNAAPSVKRPRKD